MLILNNKLDSSKFNEKIIKIRDKFNKSKTIN